MAFVAFVLLTLWPGFARRAEPDAPWGLRPRVAVSAGIVLGAATLVFFGTVLAESPVVGLYERVLAAAQVLWPAVVAWSAWWCARAPRGGG